MDGCTVLEHGRGCGRCDRSCICWNDVEGDKGTFLSALFCSIYMTLFNSDMLYYTSFVMGISESSASILYAIQSACSICLIPFITKLAISHDKRNVYVACMAERELR